MDFAKVGVFSARAGMKLFSRALTPSKANVRVSTKAHQQAMRAGKTVTYPQVQTHNPAATSHQNSHGTSDFELWRIGDLLALPKMGFQPKLKEPRLRYLRNNWNLDLLEPATVADSRETGQPAVAEGNHRLKVAEEKLGADTQVTVRRVHGLTAEEVYIGINTGRRTLPGQEKFDASFSAQNEAEMLVEKKASEYGYSVLSITSPGSGMQRVNAARTLVIIGTTKDAEERLDKTFSVVRAIQDYPGRRVMAGDDNWATARVFQGIDYLYVAFGDDLEWDRLVKRLVTATPSTAAPVNANSARRNAERMLELYNWNLRGGRLELPSEKEMSSRLRRQFKKDV